MLNAVNGRSAPGERFEGPFFSNHFFSVLKRHRELFPDSRLRKRMWRSMVAGFLFWFGAFFGIIAMTAVLQK
jgi:hypothetical protein